MKVKMKKGCPPTLVRMFGKRWKIPNDELCKEVYEVVKDQVDIVSDIELKEAEEDRLFRIKRSKERTARILAEKWAKKHPKLHARKLAEAEKAKKAVPKKAVKK
jgi:hypothetical protein